MKVSKKPQVNVSRRGDKSTFPERIEKGDRVYMKLRRDEPKDRFANYTIYTPSLGDILGFRHIIKKKGGGFTSKTFMVSELGYETCFNKCEETAWLIMEPDRSKW